MSYERLDIIPSSFTSGSTLRLDISIDDAPASEGGSIAMYLKGLAVISDSDFTYDTDDDTFTIDAPATSTTDWTPGVYIYTIRHTDTATPTPNVTIVQSGRIEILEDPSAESVIEARTFTEVVLDRLKDLMKSASLNQYKTIQIQDEIYSSKDPMQLHELIVKYEDRLYSEKQADLVEQGQSAQDDIAFQFDDEI